MAALQGLRRPAFVSPTVRGYTVVYDQEVDEQDSDAIEHLGCKVSQVLSCSALAAVLHDDDVLYLWLFQRGKVRDRYDSLPGYFDPNAEPSPPAGGNRGMLCEAFDRPGSQGRLDVLLRADLLKGELPEVPGELERHQAIATALDMPPFVAGLGYAAIAAGYVPEPFQEVEFEAVDQA